MGTVVIDKFSDVNDSKETPMEESEEVLNRNWNIVLTLSTSLMLLIFLLALYLA